MKDLVIGSIISVGDWLNLSNNRSTYNCVDQEAWGMWWYNAREVGVSGNIGQVWRGISDYGVPGSYWYTDLRNSIRGSAVNFGG